MTDWIAYTPITQSYGFISSSEFYYKQVGDTYHIQGKFKAGTVTGIEAQIGLPNNLTVSNGVTSRIVGHMALGGASSAAVSVIATAGDSFLNFGREDSGTAIIPQIGTTVANTGLIHSFYAIVPIEELSSDVSFLAAVPVQKTVYLKDVKPTGTFGGSGVAATFFTRDLNTIEGDNFASLSANIVTLPAGEYRVDAFSPARGTD